MRIVWALTFLAISTPVRAQERCTFSLVAERPTPITVEGGSDVAQAVKVVDQPDSPLAITSLDLRALALNASLSQYTMEGTISVEVMNISDTAVSQITFGDAAGWRDGYGSGRRSIATQLEPGGRQIFTFGSRGSGRTGHPDQLTVLVGVDAVSLGTCHYEPAVTAVSVLKSLGRQ